MIKIGNKEVELKDISVELKDDLRNKYEGEGIKDNSKDYSEGFNFYLLMKRYQEECIKRLEEY